MRIKCEMIRTLTLSGGVQIWISLEGAARDNDHRDKDTQSHWFMT